MAVTITDTITNASSGASFFRADLHIHSFGGSHDVNDSGMTPANIVDTAVREGLAMISITDHNEITNVSEGMKEAIKAKLFLVPGVELTTSDGHLLVYFNDIASLTTYYGKLDFADKGSDKSRCTTSLLECLNKIDIAKGFAVLAHVDGEGGYEEKVKGSPPSKSDVITHPALLGIELHSATSQVSYSDTDNDPQRVLLGKQRTQKLKLGSRQFLARVLFSDSHTINGLGKNAQGKRRLTRVKMDSPSFDGLGIALNDADARIRLEDEIPDSVPTIVGIQLDGGFLDGQLIRLSKNLTCIIGGRGAGKSTAFESVRCISAKPSVNPLIDSEPWPDTLHLVWTDKAGQTHTALRRKNVEMANLDDPQMGPTNIPVDSYGQSETAQTSKKAQDDPAALLEYIDRFIDLEEWRTKDDELRNTLLGNQTDVEKARVKVLQIPEYKKRLIDVQQQLKTLESANAKDIVALERKLAEERLIRENLTDQINDLAALFQSSEISTLLTNMETLAKPEQLKVGASELKQIISLVSSFHTAFEKVKSDSIVRVNDLADKVRVQLSQWKAQEQQVLAEIDKKRKDLQAKGIKLDYAFIQKLANDETSHTKQLEILGKWDKNLKALMSTRQDLLVERKKVRQKISNLRNQYAIKANNALKDSLTDHSVDIKFTNDALSAQAEEIIKEAMNWKTSQVPRASLIVEQITVPRLMEMIKKKDHKPFLGVTAKDGSKPFSNAPALEMLQALSQPTNRFKLERCVVEDLPRITVSKQVTEADGSVKYIHRDFAKLSLGQQLSVLLALMLTSDSDAPLLIDQPEDNLDSEFIFHSLVPVLRRAKERRQVVIVTHNANIAVLGDAEKIVALKSTSDKSMIVAQGSIDEPATRKTVCQMLEGAEEAFRRRAKVYGL